MRQRTNETSRTIVGLCKEGKSAAELSGILGIKRSAIRWCLDELIKVGTVFRGGAGTDIRYFVDPQQAQEYTVEAAERLAKSKAATAERKRVKSLERWRRANDRKLEQKEKTQPKKEQKKAAKPVRVDLSLRDSGLVIATRQQEKDHKRLHAKANIVWPKDVKITVIPTGRDMRFVAEVEPGKGQISQDAAERRKREARI